MVLNPELKARGKRVYYAKKANKSAEELEALEEDRRLFKLDLGETRGRGRVDDDELKDPVYAFSLRVKRAIAAGRDATQDIQKLEEAKTERARRPKNRGGRPRKYGAGAKRDTGATARSRGKGRVKTATVSWFDRWAGSFTPRFIPTPHFQVNSNRAKKKAQELLAKPSEVVDDIAQVFTATVGVTRA